MSAWNNLQALPEIIRFADLVRVLDTTPAGAKLLVHRWKARGLIQPLGPRVGIYLNKVRRPDWEALVPQAVALALPSVVVMGPTVLHQHGWTTQIPQCLHVAIPCQRTTPVLHGVEIHPRPRSWYARYRPAENGQQAYGLPALSPAQALCDQQEYPDEGALDPDDLDVMAIDEWWTDNVHLKASWLGVALPSTAPAPPAVCAGRRRPKA